MLNIHQEFETRLSAAVLDGDGITSRALREAIVTATLTCKEQLEFSKRPIPTELDRYLQKVSRHAYRVTDGDVAALKEQGYSEDAIFELTVCAAVGAGLGRWKRGWALLHSSRLSQPEVGDEVG
jgi:hypothetical protein